MSISTYTLYSDAAVETALNAVGGQMMGTQDTELLKQIFVAAGNATGTGGAYLPLAGGTMTGNIALTDGVDVEIGSTAGSKIGQIGSKIGFFGQTPQQKLSVSGSRADPEQAMLSLILVLSTYGLITDDTTP